MSHLTKLRCIRALSTEEQAAVIQFSESLSVRYGKLSDNSSRIAAAFPLLFDVDILKVDAPSCGHTYGSCPKCDGWS